MDVLDRMGQHGHPEEDHLEKYVMKTGTQQEADAVEEHLLLCAPCRVRLYQAEEWVALMKATLPGRPSRRRVPLPDFAQWFARPAVLTGCAAMVVAVCAAVLMLRDPLGGGEELVRLEATRGAASGAQATARKRLTIQMDTTGLTAPLQAQIVDSRGKPVLTRDLDAARPEWKLDRALPPGMYWVRIHSGSEMLREFGLEIR